MSDDIAAMMEARRAADLQRQREQLGISGAAAAGVFDSGRPPELDLVAKRDAWMREQWEASVRPQDHAVVPIFHEDGSAIAPARWDTGFGEVEGLK